jgi:serine/threonine-protein kinase HipA
MAARVVIMKAHKRTLNILMNGILVGQLEKEPAKGLMLTYDQKWLNTQGARPISLSLPLVKEQYLGDVVYNFFDNLLPDNPQVRARIQAKFQIPTTQPFDLLASIGRDCVGAIQIVDGEANFKKEIKYSRLSEKEIATILRGYQKYPLGMTNTMDEFRISIAGVQEKFAFLYYKNTWSRPIGATPTSHIFKLPIGIIQHQQIDLSDSCENEWLCMQIAAAFGLPTAKCEILYFENIKVLAIERFDRKLASDKTWLMRLPQEDMCQALGVSPNLKYQAEGGPAISAIMKLLLGSKNSVEDRDLFFQAQILFWLLANIDGHAKNFSIFIEPEGKYYLTPLYDILSVHPLLAKKQLHPQKIKMAMALTGKNNHYHWYSVQRRYFLATAKAANYSMGRAEMLLDSMLQRVDTVIEQVSAKLPQNFPKKIAKAIFDGMLLVKRKLEK